MLNKYKKRDTLTIDKIRNHYLIEKELAYRLKHSNRAERKRLYSVLYDELFRRIPYHSQIAKNKSIKKQNKKLLYQLRFLKPFLNTETIFMEVGAGNCALSKAVCQHVEKVIAIDVSNVLIKNITLPNSMELLLTDGVSIPISDNSVNIAYSNQLMEHLHPDDCFDQLKNIYNVLVHNGKYICFTPNKLSGPHDVSKYFDEVSSGFHLKEYTYTEIDRLFRKVGFRRVKAYTGIKGIKLLIPLFLVRFIESLVQKMPFHYRRNIMNLLLAKRFSLVIIIGVK